MADNLEQKFDLHVVREEGEFASIHSKLDALGEKVDQHIGEHRDLEKAIRGGLIKLAFATLGAALIGGWKWLAAKFL